MEENLSTSQNPASTAMPPTQTQQPIAPSVPKISSPTMWDAFEHILMFISLYIMATSMALIMNYFVDKWFPGVATSNYYSYSSTGSSFQLGLLRGYLAALIVSFPLFAFFFIHITKTTMVNPNTRNIKARKILIYVTLVATFMIMLFNVISTVFNLLGGNVSVNFLLHLYVAFLINGVIFAYYLYQIKEDRRINV